MPQFRVNTPVVQAEPLVKVEVSRNEPLPIGANRFRLVVVDDEGNESEPAILEVIVQAPRTPTAVLDMVDANQRRIEPVAAFGQPFILSGARSSDVAPGRVVEWRFTLIDRT